MGLTPGLSTAADLFHKLQRDVERLNQEITSDDFFDFVITGYSLLDWVKNAPSLPATAKSQSEIASLYQEPWLKVCGELANASKHFTLTKQTPITSSATSTRGVGEGGHGKGRYGVGEESIEVAISKGSTWMALEFAAGVIQAWLVFFRRNGIKV